MPEKRKRKVRMETIRAETPAFVYERDGSQWKRTNKKTGRWEKFPSLKAAMMHGAGELLAIEVRVSRNG